MLKKFSRFEIIEFSDYIAFSPDEKD